jgi:DNA-binding protein H-NS
MARRSAPPPKPKSPILTVGQKQRRIERLQKCVAKLEAFDPQKASKRAPAILELEAAIDKALSSAFGYGTPAYLRYNEAATLDPSLLLTNAAVRAAVSRPVGAPARHDAKVQETRQHFSENKARAIALLQNAIRTLEEEIAKAGGQVEESKKAKQTPDVAADARPEPKSPAKIDVLPAAPRRWAGITFESVRHHVASWLRREG